MWGLGDPQCDNEGRVLTLVFEDLAVINANFTNSQREHARLGYKLEFCKRMLEVCNSLQARGKTVILCGDYNIAHKEIDLKNPKENVDNAGFLPEERAWMDSFIATGYYVDIFRQREPGPGHYTWWSYRPGIRERNIGWRIDYHCISPKLEPGVIAVGHHPKSMGSDHCPVFLGIR